MDNKNELKTLLTSVRESTGLSQRQIAKKIGIHHSTLNDIENGRIQKIDITILIKLAEELGIDIKMLLNAAGYSKVIYLLEKDEDKITKKSTKDIKEKINQYKINQMELQNEIYERRIKVRDSRTRLNSLITKLDNYDMYKDLWTIDKINDEIKDIYKDLKSPAEKYDYSKLPKND